MNKFCCELKHFCENNPEQCPIAKENKDIADFEKAKQDLFNVVVGDIKKVFEFLIKLVKRSDTE